jgi:hypothetical protein
MSFINMVCLIVAVANDVPRMLFIFQQPYTAHSPKHLLLFSKTSKFRNPEPPTVGPTLTYQYTSLQHLRRARRSDHKPWGTSSPAWRCTTRASSPRSARNCPETFGENEVYEGRQNKWRREEGWRTGQLQIGVHPWNGRFRGGPSAGHRRVGHRKRRWNYRESMATPCHTPMLITIVFLHFLGRQEQDQKQDQEQAIPKVKLAASKVLPVFFQLHLVLPQGRHQVGAWGA